jgi:DNA polymerase-3 subunit alpha/error-prone DNA polymerase
MPEFPPGTELEQLRQEFAVLGFLCDRHPMALYAERLARVPGLVKARDVPRHSGGPVLCAGWLITGKVVSTKRGEPMEFLTFEDETGTVEATFFPRAYRRYCHLLNQPGPFLLSGKVEEDFGVCTLTVDSVRPLGRA